MGESFNSPINQTIPSLGSYGLTKNFLGPETGINYGGELTGFVKPITLELLKYDEEHSKIFHEKSNRIRLNLDYSDLGSFVRFGSTREYIRSSIEKIILNYPGSIFANPMKSMGGNNTIYKYNYDDNNNISTFKLYSETIDNPFQLIFDKNNQNLRGDNKLSNINVSHNKFSMVLIGEMDKEYDLLDFVGDDINKPHLEITVRGNPLPHLDGNGSGSIGFHIKPQKKYFDKFLLKLDDFEKHIMEYRDGETGFAFKLSVPRELDGGNIVYNKNLIKWPTSDGYNIDISGPAYSVFLQVLLNTGDVYDSIKTDLIYNLLVPKSLLTYDVTEKGKTNKLFRIYGAQFDKLRVFIDALQYIHDLSYDKINNAPDKLLNNMARTMGWSNLYIKTEKDLIEQIFSLNEIEGSKPSPDELNIELWRRILINTHYFWNAKGTRHSIRAILLLLGLPEEFINFNEFIYVADNKINPNTVQFDLSDFPTQTRSYDSDGFHKAPAEAPNFYFQISGRTDYGQRYMDVFRKVGINIYPKVDNRKIVEREGNYVEERDIDNRLLVNTKVVDINIDPAKAIEEDFYRYIDEIEYPDYALPLAYVTISLDIENEEQDVFDLPEKYNEDISEFDVHLNGIKQENFLVLSEISEFDGNWGTLDYVVGIDDKKIKLKVPISQADTLKITYIKKNEENDYFDQINNIEIKYNVKKVLVSVDGGTVTLPETPKGNIQLILSSIGLEHGIILTEGNSMYNGDYMFITNDTIRIFNPDLIDFFADNPYISISYLTHNINKDFDFGELELRSEHRIYRGFNTSKLYTTIYKGNQVYVYKLNYPVSTSIESKNIKILVDGLPIKPHQEEFEEWDYKLGENQYEIIINATRLTLGSAISAYYLIGSDVLSPIYPQDPPDSFFEFIGKLYSESIDARLRKVITDYKGGWYPLLLKYYVDYLRRGNLDPESPMLSNAYLVKDAFKFLRKYAMNVSTFMGFVKMMLPATAILRKDGVLIRNGFFARQKFMHRRGVSFNEALNYIGDDGSYFKKEYLVEEAHWDDTEIISGTTRNHILNVIHKKRHNDYDHEEQKLIMSDFEENFNLLDSFTPLEPANPYEIENLKKPVHAATTDSIDIGTQYTYIDGVELSFGDRILIKNQNDLSENGIYIVSHDGTIQNRSDDATSLNDLETAHVFVMDGNNNGGSYFKASFSGGGDIGTREISWEAIETPTLITFFPQLSDDDFIELETDEFKIRVWEFLKLYISLPDDRQLLFDENN